MEQFNNQFSEILNNVDQKLEPVKQMSRLIEKHTKKITEKFQKIMIEFDFTKLNDSFLEPMKQLSIKLDIAQRDPDSIINYMSYVENLSNYFWAMPYSIGTFELKIIFDSVNSEKEFDNYMRKYFNKQKIENLFEDIKLKTNKKHIIIFRQIEQSFYNKQYSLINNAIISIIDDELSYYTFDKGETKRKDIFMPIIEDLGNAKVTECNWLDLFYLEMLNNNLNILFDNVNFSNIVINTSKAIRRHTTQHGKKYSNKKIVSLMLLNTLYNLLYIKDDLKKYHNKLKIKRQKNGSKYYILVR